MPLRPIKYILVSASCTILDYGLYLLLLTAFPPAFCYIGARLVSATVNYQLSRRVVFRGRPSALSALEYGMLAALCMALGSLGVSMLAALDINSMLAKISLDSALFIMNYVVQKKLIFTRTEG